MKTKICLLDASIGNSPVQRNFNRELNSKIDYYRISQNEFPKKILHDGYIISGSPKSVNDKDNWIRKAERFVTKLHAKKKPVLGVCWGHQLLAKALGGVVEKLFERKIGYKKIELTKEGKNDNTVFRGIPKNFLAFITHHDSIKELPTDSKILAKKEKTIQGFKKDFAYGVQFHPEYDLKTTKHVSEKYLKGEELNKLKKTLTQKNLKKARRESGKVLKNFEEFVKTKTCFSYLDYLNYKNLKEKVILIIMPSIKRLVLDVLKPHKPDLIGLSESLCSINGVEGVNLSLYEVDQDTENIKVTIEGEGIDYSDVEEMIEGTGAVIHSVDEVAAGNRLIEEVETLQDR
ncbi:hypothetical protein C9439_05475 [archaeon SCG-AAA382B04]|nr:hypothetical protein C9439_05475 [archaeon SCG-AAA382B04]